MSATEQGLVPDMSGKAVTVLGPVEPDELGFTLTHEHIFVDLRKTHLPYRKFIVVDDRLVAYPASYSPLCIVRTYGTVEGDLRRDR